MAAIPRVLVHVRLVFLFSNLFVIRTSRALAQRSEGIADLVAEYCRLFPGCKMTAFGKFVIMNKMRKRLFRPGARDLIDLVRERAHGYRNRNVFYIKEGQFVFPV